MAFIDVTDNDDDWQFVPKDWWRISYNAVDWPHSSLLFAAPENTVAADDNDELNTTLPGVRIAEDVLGLYESLVGFHVDDNEHKAHVPEMAFELTDEQLAVHKELWDQLMSDLMQGETWSPATSSSSSGSSFALSSSISTLDGLDLARPATAEAKASPKPPSPPPVTFPSISSSPPTSAPHYPTFSDFTFPSLVAPPLPKVKIQKDEQGFYSVEEIKPSSASRPSTTFLPPFLNDATQRRKAPASKTRSIVDRLRKAEVSPVRGSISHSPSPSPPFSNDPFFHSRLSVSESGGDRDSQISIHSFDEDSDGWVGLANQEVLSSSKARRTRDLFRALRRHRSGSTSPSDSGKDSHTDDSPDSQQSVPSLSSSSPSPSSSTQSSNDGWIEGIMTPPPKVKPNRRQQSQSRGKKKNHSSSSQSVPYPQFPTAALPLQPMYPSFSPLVQPQFGTYSQPYFYSSYPMVPMQTPYVPYTVAYPVQPVMPHHIRQASSFSRPPVR